MNTHAIRKLCAFVSVYMAALPVAERIEMLGLMAEVLPETDAIKARHAAWMLAQSEKSQMELNFVLRHPQPPTTPHNGAPNKKYT